jgi:hypothetical protein
MSRQSSSGSKKEKRKATRDEALEQIERSVSWLINKMGLDRGPRGPGAPEVLPALALWGGLLVCVLHGATTQSDLWRLLAVEGLWRFPLYPVCRQAVYWRLAHEGTGPLQELFEHVSRAMHARLGPLSALKNVAAFAKVIVALDESTLDKLARKLPTLRGLPKGDPGLLGGKIAALFDVRRQLWRKVMHTQSSQQNEKVLARQMVEDLPRGSLILADLGYFAFAWFDWLQERGYLWLSRLKAKVTYELKHVQYQDGETLDAIIWLGKYRSDRAAHAVRLVQFRAGKSLHRYVTNVLDPKLLPLHDIAQLYARRWDIELAFDLLKTHLGLHLLWSAKPVVIEQQLWAVLIIAQVLQSLRLEIAQQADCDPSEVSMALLVKYLPRYAAKGLDAIAIFVERGRHAGFIRPSRRNQIRAPVIPLDEIRPCPEHLELHRKPRYAQKDCTSRKKVS